MLYGGSVTVPQNTAETSPVVTYFKVSHGVLTRVLFYPRPGHAGLCHAKVYRRTHQIVPADLEQDLHGDAYPIIFDEWHEIFGRPYELKVVAWNEDDTYSHTFDIWFEVIPKASTMRYALAAVLGDLISALLPRSITPEE